MMWNELVMCDFEWCPSLPGEALKQALCDRLRQLY